MINISIRQRKNHYHSCLHPPAAKCYCIVATSQSEALTLGVIYSMHNSMTIIRVLNHLEIGLVWYFWIFTSSGIYKGAGIMHISR